MKIFLFCILILIVAACQQDLYLLLPFEGKKLILYSELSQDKVFGIEIQKTYSPNDSINFDDGVETAKVQIYEDGLLLQNLTHIKKGFYQSPNLRPKIGKSYFFRVSALGYPDAESSPEIIPPIITPLSYQFTENVISIYNTGIPTRKLTLSFQDIPNQTNLYSFKVFKYHDNELNSGEVFSIDRSNIPEDLCGFAGNGYTFNYRDICFTDKTKSIAIGIELEGILQGNGKKSKTNKVVLAMRSASNSYFENLRYLTFHSQPFLNTLSLPVSGFSNIKNGYGVVSAYSQYNLILTP